MTNLSYQWERHYLESNEICLNKSRNSNIHHHRQILVCPIGIQIDLHFEKFLNCPDILCEAENEEVHG